MSINYKKFLRVYLSPLTNGNNKVFYVDYSNYSPDWFSGKRVWCIVEHFFIGSLDATYTKGIYLYSNLHQSDLILNGNDNSPDHILISVSNSGTGANSTYNYNMNIIENGFPVILQSDIKISCKFVDTLADVTMNGQFKLILRFYEMN